MGLFTWLGSLVDTWLGNLVEQLIDWLGREAATFIEALARGIEKLWNTVIAATLIAAFGVVSILYVIFYAGSVLGETIMEIWDPMYFDSKPSQIFTLKQAPQGSPLPEERSEAKVLVLEDAF